MDTLNITRNIYDDANEEKFIFKSGLGVSKALVRQISADKEEPEWMLKKRLEAHELFENMDMPNFGPDLSDLNFDEIHFYMRPDAKKNSESWEDVPADIRETYEKLGIPKAEREALAGVGAQYESEVVYHKLKKELAEQGVVFLDCDEGLKQYPELFKKYFMTTCVATNLHKFSALHAAVWSGGTFIYIPKNVKVKLPLQAYFRMNAKKGGQFEHTLIIADEGSEVHYIEGCSAPRYDSNSLHAGCVEIHVLKGARVRYSSIENWSKNTYNLNTKRAVVYENGIMEWVNGNTGCLTENSKVFTNSMGPKNIKSIKTGDNVFVWDEDTNSIKTSKVKSKIFSGNKKVYRLSSGGREIEASSNHPFLTLIREKNNPNHKKGFFKLVWKPLEELKRGDLVGIIKKLPHKGKSYHLPKIKIGKEVSSKNQYSSFKMDTSYLYNKNIKIPEETNKDFMWLMGLIMGDGHIDLKNNKINIATHEKEDYRDDLIKLLKKLFNYNVTEKKERYIIVNSKILCELFSEIGFSGTADTKKMPPWVFTLPEKQIFSLLAGYIDSDGHISKNAVYLTSVSKNLLEDVKFLGIQIGLWGSKIFEHGKARNSEILGKKVRLKDSWRLFFNGKNVKSLPLKCKAKKDKINKLKTRRNYSSSKGFNFKSKVNEEIGFSRVNKIEETGIKPTFDIEVEGYHNFIANGLIVHNSKVTMLYPSSVLIGKGASTDYVGIAYAAKGMYQDTGCKVYHLAENTTSHVISKSISMDGGITNYRGLVKIKKGCKGAKSSVRCDGLMLDDRSKSGTVPAMEVEENDVNVSHEAAIGKIGEEQLFYLMSRGLNEKEATKMIVSGFIEPLIKELPLEYAVELNRLIELEIENSVV
ncbi:MAG: Fe-S cluster assembly protein SufB [Nanoarchaeota archaeon]